LCLRQIFFFSLVLHENSYSFEHHQESVWKTIFVENNVHAIRKDTVMVVKDDLYLPAIGQSAISKPLSAKTNSTWSHQYNFITLKVKILKLQQFHPKDCYQLQSNKRKHAHTKIHDSKALHRTNKEKG
jgi:hypothetical protein